MEDAAWLFADPCQDLGALVGRIVIDDDMGRLLLRHPRVDDIEEVDELLMDGVRAKSSRMAWRTAGSVG